MEGPYSERPWFWVTLMLSRITLAAIVFAAWELVENRFFRDLDYVTLHYLYITRGIASSLLLACWAAWYVLRQRIRLQRHLLEIEKLTSMGKMAAGTAHHLNTPLAAMLLRVQMMRDRAPENVDLERLESGLRFCQHFVQRLLEFSRRPAPARQPEDVAHVLDCVLSFLAPQSLACKARISTEIEYGRGRMVTADRNQLEALFSILVSNALDAVEEHGHVKVRCLPAAPGRIAIEIADDGCGINAGDAPHLFEPFFTTKAPGKGTGLGLAIAQNIVHEHGGAIRLENAPVRGTIARVELPLCAASAARQNDSGSVAGCEPSGTVNLEAAVARRTGGGRS